MLAVLLISPKAEGANVPVMMIYPESAGFSVPKEYGLFHACAAPELMEACTLVSSGGMLSSIVTSLELEGRCFDRK